MRRNLRRRRNLAHYLKHAKFDAVIHLFYYELVSINCEIYMQVDKTILSHYDTRSHNDEMNMDRNK